MIPFVQDTDFTLYVGDALTVLCELPDESVDCAATSPPFFGLRDYQVEGQIGLEATPELWTEQLVDVFRELRRVLVKTGTLWIECGDSYNSQGKMGPTSDRSLPQPGMGYIKRELRGLKHKDLIGAPFLLAFALRADGWWWRSINVWHKPNCLPESATDRPTVAHSYVFQFSKAARYFHNAEAVREPAEWARWGDQTVVKEQPGKAGWIQAAEKADLESRYVNRREDRKKDEREIDPKGYGTRTRADAVDGQRNLRSVWSIPTQGFPDAHFATWPEALIERIIKMACPEQVCRTCGKPREPIVDAPTYGTLGAEGAARQTGGNSRNQYGGQKKWEQI